MRTDEAGPVAEPPSTAGAEPANSDVKHLPVWTPWHHSWRHIALVILACDAAIFGAITWNWEVVVAVLAIDLVLPATYRRYSFTVIDAPARYLVTPLVASLATVLAGDVLFFGRIVFWHYLTIFIVFVVAQLLSAWLSIGIGVQIRKRWPRPAVIIGAGTIAETLAHTLREHREYGLVPVGFVTNQPTLNTTLPQVTLRQGAEEIDRTRATDVICASDVAPDADLEPLLRELQTRKLRIGIVTRFSELNTSADHIWGISLWVLPTALPQEPIRMALRRVIEIIFVAAAIILLSPVLLGAALAVRLTSRGPVLYEQKRIGKGGREFTVYKFRSMRVDADEISEWTVKHDPRRTTVGRFLRKTGIDELPQLFNVLKGNMSLVGPRPERGQFVRQFESEVPSYRDRERVAAGLTGWAQVEGLRGDTSIEERARFDNRYIDHPSIGLDVWIMLRTLREMFRGQ